MQNNEYTTIPTRIGSIEIEGSVFLLLASGLFFGLETLFHYESFLHQISIKSVVPEALVLVIGSGIISVTYCLLSYFCWKGSSNSDNFVIAQFVSGILIFAYFVVEISASAFPEFTYATNLEYGQFVSGYGSVTIFVEMLVFFFTYRATRILDLPPS